MPNKPRACKATLDSALKGIKKTADAALGSNKEVEKVLTEMEKLEQNIEQVKGRERTLSSRYAGLVREFQGIDPGNPGIQSKFKCAAARLPGAQVAVRQVRQRVRENGGVDRRGAHVRPDAANATPAGRDHRQSNQEQLAQVLGKAEALEQKLESARRAEKTLANVEKTVKTLTSRTNLLDTSTAKVVDRVERDMAEAARKQEEIRQSITNTSNSLGAQREAVTAQLDAVQKIQSEQAGLKSRASAATTQVRNVERDAKQLETETKSASRKLSDVESAVGTAESTKRRLEEKLETLRGNYRELNTDADLRQLRGDIKESESTAKEILAEARVDLGTIKRTANEVKNAQRDATEEQKQARRAFQSIKESERNLATLLGEIGVVASGRPSVSGAQVLGITRNLETLIRTAEQSLGTLRRRGVPQTPERVPMSEDGDDNGSAQPAKRRRAGDAAQSSSSATIDDIVAAFRDARASVESLRQVAGDAPQAEQVLVGLVRTSKDLEKGLRDLEKKYNDDLSGNANSVAARVSAVADKVDRWQVALQQANVDDVSVEGVKRAVTKSETALAAQEKAIEKSVRDLQAKKQQFDTKRAQAKTSAEATSAQAVADVESLANGLLAIEPQIQALEDTKADMIELRARLDAAKSTIEGEGAQTQTLQEDVRLALRDTQVILEEAESIANSVQTIGRELEERLAQTKRKTNPTDPPPRRRREVSQPVVVPDPAQPADDAQEVDEDAAERERKRKAGENAEQEQKNDANDDDENNADTDAKRPAKRTRGGGANNKLPAQQAYDSDSESDEWKFGAVNHV